MRSAAWPGGHWRTMDNDLYRVRDTDEHYALCEKTNSCQEEIPLRDIDCNEMCLEAEDVNRKRLRDTEGSSSEEGWQTLSRGRKIVRRDSQQVENEIQVLATCSTPMPKQFALARLFKINNINGVNRVKYIHQFKILITFEKSIDADRFIQCGAFRDLNWRCQKTSEVGISFGIIRDIDLDIKEEDIMKEVSSDVEVIYAKRLNKRSFNGDAATGWVPCEAIRLAFRGPSLPAYVLIHGLKVNVKPYVFPVTQCSRCWKFGHTRLQCPSKKIVCPKCTKDHDNCETIVFRCVNCTGDHMALQKVCPVYKKERRIRELMSEFNCTYRKALTLYVPPSPIPDKQTSLRQIPISSERHETSQPAVNDGVEKTIVQPDQQKKLMSHLFTGSEPTSSKTTQNHKPKKQRKRTSKINPTLALISSPMETSNEKSEWSEEETRTHEENPKDPRTSRSAVGIGFIKLLSTLYQVVRSRDSLEAKIQMVVKSCTEWILSVIVGCISVDSLFSIFTNDG